MKNIVDLHIHIVPGIDDGSQSIEESLQILKIAESQGVSDVFCTSHNSYRQDNNRRYTEAFLHLQTAVKDAKININLHRGCEILCYKEAMNDIIHKLSVGQISTLGNSNYVLTEFFPDTEASEVLEIINTFIQQRYRPIIAHLERNYNISDQSLKELIELGALVQVNAYSFVDEVDSKIRDRAQQLLKSKHIHFIGSDAHSIEHRPPKISSGVQYILKNATEEYSSQILNKNLSLLLEGTVKMNSIEEKIKAVVLGHAVGDAMGVPVEFCTREELDQNPVTSMQGFGTYPVPAGSWSDDTSMSLAELDSLAQGQLSFEGIMFNFSKWYYKDEYTPTGKVFDIGTTCSKAIENYFELKLPYGAWGESDEHSNGNGSLMRIYPFVLYKKYANYNGDFLEMIHDASGITHDHRRSHIGCGIYALILDLLLDTPAKESISKGLKLAKEYYKTDDELVHYSRIFVDSFSSLSLNEIRSGGYIVDTLEAALWCLLTTNSYAECVLKAVNLGDDTDTVAAIAGSLAGALYGLNSIPKQWLDTLIQKEYIEELCTKAYNNWSTSTETNTFTLPARSITFDKKSEPEVMLQKYLLSYYVPEMESSNDPTQLFEEWNSLINSVYESAKVLNQSKEDLKNIINSGCAKKMNVSLCRMYEAIGTVNEHPLFRRSMGLETLMMVYAREGKALFKEKIEKFFARQIIEQLYKTNAILFDEIEDRRQTRRLRTNYKKISTEKPCAEDLIDKSENALENYEHSDRYSYSVTIPFTELIVLSNAFFCAKNHAVKPVSATFRILTPQGVEHEKTATIGYCENCHKYILLKRDFDELRKHGVLLCQIISSDYNKQPNYSNLGYGDLKAESILHQSGYNVSKTENLTTAQRQGILRMVLDHDLYAKVGIMSFLDWLIARGKKNIRGNMSAAVEKWKEDREFVSNYQKNNQETISVNRIKYRN